MIYFNEFNSPVGKMRMFSDGEAITRLDFIGQKHAELHNHDNLLIGNKNNYHVENAILTHNITVFVQLKQQLEEYFNAKLTKFNIPLSPQGSDFQRIVWSELMKIEYGNTASYGDIAKRCEKYLGRKTSPRAVGNAVGHNPIGIIIPCHRVLGADGSLTGFAAGLYIKKFLLAIENIHYKDE